MELFTYIPSQTPFLAWERRGICCLSSHSSSFLAGLGSARSGHPTRTPGRNLGKNKEQNLVQLCRKPPGMAVPPPHRVVPSTELPQSSAEAWFSLGRNAGLGGAEELPSLVAEIQYIKLVPPAKGTSQVLPAGLLKLHDSVPTLSPVLLKPLGTKNK